MERRWIPRTRHSSRFVLAALVVSSSATAASGPWAETEQSSVRLVSRWSTAVPGGDAGLGVEFRLLAGWHVYWKNAGDAGYPPEVELAEGPLDGLQLLYPAPHRFDLPGGLVAFGYEDEVVYPLSSRLAAGAGSPARLAVDIDYLVCAEQCIPYRARLALELPLADAPTVDEEIAALLDLWRRRLPTPATEIIDLSVTGSLRRATGPELDLELALDADGLVPRSPDLFFAPQPLLVVERPVSRPTDAGAAYAVHLRPLDETRPLPERLSFQWTATGFELDGRPLALDGTLELARPLAAAALGAPVRWAAALAAVALLAYFIHRRSRREQPAGTGSVH